MYISNKHPQSDFGLKQLSIHFNLTPVEYYEHALKDSGTTISSCQIGFSYDNLLLPRELWIKTDEYGPNNKNNRL